MCVFRLFVVVVGVLLVMLLLSVLCFVVFVVLVCSLFVAVSLLLILRQYLYFFTVIMSTGINTIIIIIPFSIIVSK